MVYAKDLKPEHQAAALTALQNSTKPDDLRQWIVKVPELAGAEHDVYLKPIKTTATADNPIGWGVFNVKKDGSVFYDYSLFDTPYNYGFFC